MDSTSIQIWTLATVIRDLKPISVPFQFILQEELLQECFWVLTFHVFNWFDSIKDCSGSIRCRLTKKSKKCEKEKKLGEVD